MTASYDQELGSCFLYIFILFLIMCLYVCVSVHIQDTEEILAPLEGEL